MTISLLAASVLLLSGCVGSTSPYAASPTAPSTVSAGQVVALGLGTAGGALAGRALDPKHQVQGEVIGGVVGLAGTALTENYLNKKSAAETNEAYEQGKRDERETIMKQYWSDQTLSVPNGANMLSPGAPAQDKIQYDAGTYEGVNLAPREATQQTISEPDRAH